MVVKGERPRLGHPAIRRSMRPALFAGRDNRVEGRGLHAQLLRLTTFIVGSSSENLVTVGANFHTKGLFIDVSGSGNRIEIGDDVRLTGKISIRGSGLTLRIGDRCDIKTIRIVASEADVTIGRDCLVAARVRMRSGDVHSIIDRTNGARINPSEPVSVGDGVWIAGEAALLKGARVPDGCIVGFRAVVLDAFDEPDCVLVGSPARVVRRGITWKR